MIVLDADTGEEAFRRESPSGRFDWVEFSPDGTLLVTASSGTTAKSWMVTCWSAKSGEQLQSFHGHTSYVNQAAFVRDNERIVSASSDGSVRLWNVKNGKEIRRLKNPGPVRQFLLNTDGTRLLTKWSVGDVYSPSGASLWDIETGREILQMPDAADGLVGFTPDGKRFLLVNLTGRLAAMHDSNTGAVLRRYE